MRTHLTAVLLWNNQFPETKILGLPASRRMPGLVYMASRDKVDVDTFHNSLRAGSLVRQGRRSRNREPAKPARRMAFPRPILLAGFAYSRLRLRPYLPNK